MTIIDRLWQHCATQCQLCGLTMTSADSHPLWCNTCIHNAFPSQARCQQCGLRTLISVPHCGECLKSPPPWHQLYCLGDYQKPLSSYVHQLKYRNELQLADALTRLLADSIEDCAPLITSVPLHWRRFLWRGYNQSHILAQGLVKHLHAAGHNTDYQRLLKRIKATPHQQGLARKARQSNLNRAFHLRNDAAALIQPYEHIAIVDDVVTTGSTIRQLCHLLLEVGVKKIDIYCLCRTPEPSN